VHATPILLTFIAALRVGNLLAALAPPGGNSPRDGRRQRRPTRPRRPRRPYPTPVFVAAARAVEREAYRPKRRLLLERRPDVRLRVVRDEAEVAHLLMEGLVPDEPPPRPRRGGWKLYYSEEVGAYDDLAHTWAHERRSFPTDARALFPGDGLIHTNLGVAAMRDRARRSLVHPRLLAPDPIPSPYAAGV